MERRLPTLGGTSVVLGAPDAPLGKPMGLVLERLTVPDLKHDKHNVFEIKVRIK